MVNAHSQSLINIYLTIINYNEAVPAEQDNPVVGTLLLSDHKNE